MSYLDLYLYVKIQYTYSIHDSRYDKLFNAFEYVYIYIQRLGE